MITQFMPLKNIGSRVIAIHHRRSCISSGWRRATSAGTTTRWIGRVARSSSRRFSSF